MSAPQLGTPWEALFADRHGKGTARVEATAAGRLHQAGNLPSRRQRRQTTPGHQPIRVRSRREQQLGIGMLGPLGNLLAGSAFRQALHGLAQRPFRVKPWFAPGPWGGQWMKEQFDLPRDQPNYAWSFELIAPENGLLLGDGERVLECAFDYLLWQETDAVLGRRLPLATAVTSPFALTIWIRWAAPTSPA